MKKIVVLSLILLTGFVALIYTKQVFADDDYVSMNDNAGVAHSSDNGSVIGEKWWKDSTGTDNFSFNYSDGGLINGTIWNDSSGSTHFKSKASYLNGGSLDGTIDSSGAMHFDPAK